MNFCLLNSTNIDLSTSSNDNGNFKPLTSTITSTNSSSILPQHLAVDGTLHKVNKANVSLLLPMSAKFAQSLQSAEHTNYEYKGDILATTKISLGDMSRAVPPHYHHYTISVMVNLPAPTQTNSSDSQADVEKDEENVYACFNIEAPINLMQDLNRSLHLPNECTITRSNLVSSSPRRLLAHTGDHLPPSWCNQRGAAPIKLEYFEDKPSWTVYISTADKKMINLHLMATSVFLFALLGVIVLVMFVKGSLISRKLHSQRHSTEVNNLELPLTKANSG